MNERLGAGDAPPSLARSRRDFALLGIALFAGAGVVISTRAPWFAFQQRGDFRLYGAIRLGPSLARIAIVFMIVIAACGATQRAPRLVAFVSVAASGLLVCAGVLVYRTPFWRLDVDISRRPTARAGLALALAVVASLAAAAKFLPPVRRKPPVD